jgi:glycosyl transferase, family 25
MKVFVVHYDKLIKRKYAILKQLHDQNIEPEFVSNHGKETLTKDEIDSFNGLSLTEISIFLHHIECYKKIVENEYDFALILEDDVILNKNFFDILEDYMKHLPKDWDVFYVGDGCDKHIPLNVLNKYKNCRAFRNNEDRCADSYLISKKTANLIYTIFRNKINNKIKIDLAIDMWMNRLYKTMPFLKIFWAEPTISTQGSQKDIYKSTIYHTMGSNDNYIDL